MISILIDISFTMSNTLLTSYWAFHYCSYLLLKWEAFKCEGLQTRVGKSVVTFQKGAEIIFDMKEKSFFVLGHSVRHLFDY